MDSKYKCWLETKSEEHGHESVDKEDESGRCLKMFLRKSVWNFKMFRFDLSQYIIPPKDKTY